MFFGDGEICGYKVGVAEAGVALDKEEIECFLSGVVAALRWLPGAEHIEFVHGEIHPGHGLASSCFKLIVWVLCNDTE